MKIAEAHLKFKQYTETNMTDSSIGSDKPRFIMLFRAAELRYIENVLDKRNEDEIRTISKLLVVDKVLGKVGDKETHSSFLLPKDYLEHAGAWAKASKDKCSDRIKLFEIKSEDIEESFPDANSEPSFEYRESFYHSASDEFLVYRKDFKVDKVFLTYYRLPRKVDISGYIHLDNTPSTDVDPELPDKAVEKILRIMAKELSINSGNPQQSQLDNARIVSPV
jgi:hypothetical protein